MSVFDTLYALNVNEYTEKKQTGGTQLTYLSWANAWAEVMKKYPDATYTIWKDEQNRPYIFDASLGYMVFTTVTIDGITREMWLPVMDGANHAMKAEPYTIHTKYKEIPVEAATMFDVNKTVMRCLVKNLSMFGLGLYIYAGEDLPEGDEPEPTPAPAKKAEPKKEPGRATKEEIVELFNLASSRFGDEVGKKTLQDAVASLGKKKSTDLTHEECLQIKEMLGGNN